MRKFETLIAQHISEASPSHFPPPAPAPAPAPAAPAPAPAPAPAAATPDDDAAPTTEIPTFDEKGELKNESQLAITMYNSFAAAIQQRKNWVSPYELYDPKTIRPQSKTGTPLDPRGGIDASQPTMKAPIGKIFSEINKFIKSSPELSKIIRVVTPEQAAIMDKGGIGKRMKTGFDKMAGEQIRTAGNLAGKVNYN